MRKGAGKQFSEPPRATDAPGSLEAIGTPLSQFLFDTADVELEASVIHTPNYEVKS